MALKTLMQWKIKIKLCYVQRSLLSHTATKTVKFFKIVVKVVLWTFCLNNSTLPRNGWEKKNACFIIVFIKWEKWVGEKHKRENYNWFFFFFGLDYNWFELVHPLSIILFFSEKFWMQTLWSSGICNTAVVFISAYSYDKSYWLSVVSIIWSSRHVYIFDWILDIVSLLSTYNSLCRLCFSGHALFLKKQRRLD